MAIIDQLKKLRVIKIWKSYQVLCVHVPCFHRPGHIYGTCSDHSHVSIVVDICSDISSPLCFSSFFTVYFVLTSTKICVSN